MDSTPWGERKKNVQKTMGETGVFLFACCLLTRRQISNGFSSLFSLSRALDGLPPKAWEGGVGDVSLQNVR